MSTVPSVTIERQQAFHDFVAACSQIPADNTNRQELLNIVSRFSIQSNNSNPEPLTTTEADRLSDILNDFPEIVDTISNVAWQYNERIMSKVRNIPIIENGRSTYPDEDGYYNLAGGPLHGIQAAEIYQLDRLSGKISSGRGFSYSSAWAFNSRSIPWKNPEITFFMDSHSSDTDARRNRIVGEFNKLNAATGLSLQMMGRGSIILRRTRYRIRVALWTLTILRAVRIRIKIDGTAPGSATVGSMLQAYLRYSPETIDKQFFSWNSRNTDESLQHEIGHVLGMIHEHQRFDRDTYITITAGGTGRQFEKIPEYDRTLFTGGISTTHDTPYDYNSIMHYPTTSYADNMFNEYTIINPNHVIRGKQDTRQNLSQYGHTNGHTWLTPWDIYSIKKMYNISNNPRPDYTPGTDLSHPVFYDYQDGGGTLIPDPRIYPAGVFVTTFPVPDVDKPGHVFSGWEITLNGTNSIIPPGGSFIMPGAHVILSAKWIPTVERTIYYKPTTDMTWDWYVIFKISDGDFDYSNFPGEKLTREGEWRVWRKTTVEEPITLLFTSAIGTTDMCLYTVASNTAWLHDWATYYYQPF